MGRIGTERVKAMVVAVGGEPHMMLATRRQYLRLRRAPVSGAEAGRDCAEAGVRPNVENRRLQWMRVSVFVGVEGANGNGIYSLGRREYAAPRHLRGACAKRNTRALVSRQRLEVGSGHVLSLQLVIM